MRGRICFHQLTLEDNRRSYCAISLVADTTCGVLPSLTMQKKQKNNNNHLSFSSCKSGFIECKYNIANVSSGCQSLCVFWWSRLSHSGCMCSQGALLVLVIYLLCELSPLPQPVSPPHIRTGKPPHEHTLNPAFDPSLMSQVYLWSPPLSITCNKPYTDVL